MPETIELESSHQGVANIGGIELECHMLTDGTRVFSSKDIAAAFRLPFDPKNQPRVFHDFLAKIKFNSLDNKELSNRLIVPIKFKIPGKGGLPNNGYPVELIPEVCSAVLKMASDILHNVEYRKSIDQSRRILSGLANIGIIALVDEATGYQDIRDRDALQKILDLYLREDRAEWAKKFPDEFYKQIFRLKRWQWHGMHVSKPQVIGHYTNDIVYSRLAPGILEELRKLNPADDKGMRADKHHQYLTSEIGHPELDKHLASLITLMRISQTWDEFHRKVVQAFPKQYEQLELLLDED